MDLKLDEQLLLADFRRLDPTGKKELMEYAACLAKKCRAANPEEPATENQCPLAEQPEERPEAAEEPIFTE